MGGQDNAVVCSSSGLLLEMVCLERLWFAVGNSLPGEKSGLQ